MLKYIQIDKFWILNNLMVYKTIESEIDDEDGYDVQVDMNSKHFCTISSVTKEKFKIEFCELLDKHSI